MNSFKSTFFVFLTFGFFSCFSISAQQEQINWVSFEQLEDSLSVKPKKVFISFYADWCAYCKKMDKVALKDPKIIAILNSEYYAIKMNAETRDTISFEGKKFFNKEFGKKRRPTHQIPLLLASRKGRSFSLPAIIILDEHFQLKSRSFEYLSTAKMLKFIK